MPIYWKIPLYFYRQALDYVLWILRNTLGQKMLFWMTPLLAKCLFTLADGCDVGCHCPIKVSIGHSHHILYDITLFSGSVYTPIALHQPSMPSPVLSLYISSCGTKIQFTHQRPYKPWEKSHFLLIFPEISQSKRQNTRSLHARLHLSL